MGKGNNSVLVKSIIKHRPWWGVCQSEGEANLNWTQGKSRKFVERMYKGQRIEEF